MMFERFGGLNLASDPGQVGLEAATDTLNVDLAPDRSRVFTRAGSAQIATLASSTCVALLPTTLSGVDYMMSLGKDATNGIILQRVTSAGVVTTPYVSGLPADTLGGQLVGFGTPSVTYVVGTTRSSSGYGTHFTYDGTTLSYKSYIMRFLEVTPQTNRLVLANFLSAPEGPSTVFFSDAGSPSVFSANNYVNLHPGDGEEITGMTTWRDLLIVFKETRAFVFYGESTDSTGKPVFNYRQITLASAIRSGVSYNRSVATLNGVYFVAVGGVYRTTGGPPVKVSGALDGALDFSAVAHISAVSHRVIIQMVGGSHYVYDERSDQWLVWLFPGGTSSPLVSWPRTLSSGSEIVFASGSSLYKTSDTLTTDAGAAIASRYRTGVSDLGSPAQKVIRELLIDGSGAPNVSVATDWKTQPAGVPVTLGTSPAVAQGRFRSAVRGRNFRVQFDATSGAWAVNRFGLMVRSQRPAGLGA